MVVDGSGGVRFIFKVIFKSHFQSGGSAHKAHVLSALELMKENSLGCQRPEMTLSWCWATTILGSDMVRSPWNKSIHSLTIDGLLHDSNDVVIADADDHDSRFIRDYLQYSRLWV